MRRRVNYQKKQKLRVSFEAEKTGRWKSGRRLLRRRRHEAAEARPGRPVKTETPRTPPGLYRRAGSFKLSVAKSGDLSPLW